MPYSDIRSFAQFMVSRVSLQACQCAPSTARPIGMPRPSVRTRRVVADLAAIRRVLAHLSPPRGALGIAPSIRGYQTITSWDSLLLEPSIRKSSCNHSLFVVFPLAPAYYSVSTRGVNSLSEGMPVYPCSRVMSPWRFSRCPRRRTTGLPLHSCTRGLPITTRTEPSTAGFCLSKDTRLW